MLTNRVKNIRAKNYRNLIIRFQVTVENVGDVFWGTQCRACIVHIIVHLTQKILG